jgi:membrane fusion protein (multidrug efflux system)
MYRSPSLLIDSCRFRSVVVIVLTAVTGSLILSGCSRNESAGPGASSIREVGVATVRAESLDVTAELAGRTVAPVIAEIRPQVGGIIQKRLFVEGTFVKAGQVLYQIDPVPFEATLESARAGVRRAESALATAKTVAARNAELVRIDAISKQLNEETQAAAFQAEADLAINRAAQKTAAVNLAYTRIVAPISGWASLSTVTPGALVTANQTAVLTTVQQLDPLHVHVTQSSADLLRLKRELGSGRLSRDDTQDAPIELRLEDGSVYPHPGRLTFNGVTVDASTGSVTLRAVVPNPQGLLMPGMYVRALLRQGRDDSALLIPQPALTRAADGSASTLVVGADQKVVRRPIRVGRAIGTRWQVLEGLKPGDRVLVEGSQRVRAGDTVRAVELQAAAPEMARRDPHSSGMATAPNVSNTAIPVAVSR